MLPDRFWQKVTKTDTCWLWTAAVNAKGYGLISWKGKSTLAHRLAYSALVGEPGPVLDHLCRTHNCVNPAHLESVSQKENCLRGFSGLVTGAAQRAKTHCPAGHEYSAENTYVCKREKRTCKKCRKEASRKFLQKKVGK